VRSPASEYMLIWVADGAGMTSFSIINCNKIPIQWMAVEPVRTSEGMAHGCLRVDFLSRKLSCPACLNNNSYNMLRALRYVKISRKG